MPMDNMRRICSTEVNAAAISERHESFRGKLLNHGVIGLAVLRASL